MKKTVFVLILSITGLTSLTGCYNETVIPESDLPSEIKSYITTHFPSNKILQIVKDRDGFTKTYDVVLDGNINLEFNRKKKIIDIDGTSKLPESVIPSKILDYVSVNYPENFITDWENDGKNQQIELNNGLDLEFNMSGDFLRIDA